MKLYFTDHFMKLKKMKAVENLSESVVTVLTVHSHSMVAGGFELIS